MSSSEPIPNGSPRMATFRRWLRRGLWTVLGVVALLALLAGGVWWYLHPPCTRAAGAVYTQRHGRDLTFEIVRPQNPNGLGILLLVSGGWKSKPDSFRPWLVAPLLRRGYTVFAVSHLSQPDTSVMDTVADLHRAVRFIRHHAQKFGVDPARLGVTGGSSGGHLSLMLATRGGPGEAESADPIERQSSAVQCVAIFFPVTDLLNLGSSTQNPGDGGPPKSFVKAFGPQASTNLAAWKVVGHEVSPIYHITPALPPVLIHHGDADTLTPLEQSQWFQARAREAGRAVEIHVRPGGGHGWLTMVFDIGQFADWFDRHLRKG